MGPSFARTFALGALLTIACGAGCNLLTGAEDLEIEGDDGDGGEGSGASGQGSSGAGAGNAGSGAGNTGASCGDGACDGSETCETCAADCGLCGPACGDGACDGSETCADCPGDCGPCGPACGDGACNGSESCETCASDCGPCGPACGDGACNGSETCETCASDCGACSTCGGAGDATTPLDAEEQAFLVLINNYRAQNGLGALAACTSLNRAAQGHSEDMRDKNYFSHTGKNGSSPWSRACDACYALGCGPQTAMAENIAAGNSGAQATFMQWKNSPGHNANMLGSSFTMIGIGRATGGGQYGVYWTNVFGGSSEPSCN